MHRSVRNNVFLKPYHKIQRGVSLASHPGTNSRSITQKKSNEATYCWKLTIACSILLSMATTLAPDELKREKEKCVSNKSKHVCPSTETFITRNLWTFLENRHPAFKPRRYTGSAARIECREATLEASSEHRASIKPRRHQCLQVRPAEPDRGTPLPQIYLLSRLRRGLSALSNDDRNDMERFLRWQTPRSIATE